MTDKKILQVEEKFHDKWAKHINLRDLYILEAFEGPVSPEYHKAIELLGNINGKRILNPGCGAGEEAIYLTQKKAKVTAVDLSGGMIHVAKKLASQFKYDKKIIFQKQNVEKLSFQTGSFDLILGNSFLHHLAIDDAAKELHRVLKKNGKAVFIEPLAYNPLINYYRRIANIVRTPYEHPFKLSDIKLFSKYFQKVNHYEYQFTTLLIFVFFFLFEGVHPNQDRYWKKIIREGKKYSSLFKTLYAIDKILLNIFPFLKRYCWVTVIETIK